MAGRKEKIHLYLDEFAIDSERPYFIEEAPDVLHAIRTVFVFRLRPVGSFLQREEDLSGAGDVRDHTKSDRIPLEVHETFTFERAASPSGTALRRESDLVARYTHYLSVLGHDVGRWRVTPEGGTRALYTDIYDEHTNELYEAKGTSARDAVQLAIGQLFHYRLFMKVRDLKLAVLLPSCPSTDLIKLLKSLSIACVYETTPNSFQRIDP